MLAPLRDYLSPKDPKSPLLLRATKELYFTWMSTKVDLINPDFKETQWIMSEDTNVEHLLDVFTMIDANSGNVRDACANSVEPKIKGLPNDHHLKLECYVQLMQLFDLVGNQVESI